VAVAIPRAWARLGAALNEPSATVGFDGVGVVGGVGGVGVVVPLELALEPLELDELAPELALEPLVVDVDVDVEPDDPAGVPGIAGPPPVVGFEAITPGVVATAAPTPGVAVLLEAARAIELDAMTAGPLALDTAATCDVTRATDAEGLLPPPPPPQPTDPARTKRTSANLFLPMFPDLQARPCEGQGSPPPREAESSRDPFSPDLWCALIVS
jgi:hypothetical protein